MTAGGRNRSNALATEADLIAAAATLAGCREGWTAAERRLVRDLPEAPESTVLAVREELAEGGDPLGEAFCRIRSPLTRRLRGAVYTPGDVVDAMVSWSAGERVRPARIVDPGAGSGRFLAAAADRFPSSRLIAVEIDPVAALVLRATAETKGFAARLTLEVTDYRGIRLPRIEGATLFIGNPPYVRHHDIEKRWKDWYARVAAQWGIKASKLAGLHLHFFFKTMAIARDGDYGAFVTAAEWLDANYGRALCRLLADGLGGTALHVLDPAAAAFPDAAATAAITCFRVGRRPPNFRVRAVKTRESLNGLAEGRDVPWTEVETAPRWSVVVRPSQRPSAGQIELGELFRVHRGQVTGANRVWIAGGHARDLPETYLLPTVTRARELLDAGGVLADAGVLRQVIDLPADLDELPLDARPAVERFLCWARDRHADSSYVARNRRSWWSVGLREPAPIVCTYMARRPPAFVRNVCGARLLNIAHGLYPREPLTEEATTALVAWLGTNVRLDAGRAYAGGLTKFEPKEVERISIPDPEHLSATAATGCGVAVEARGPRPSKSAPPSRPPPRQDSSAKVVRPRHGNTAGVSRRRPPPPCPSPFQGEGTRVARPRPNGPLSRVRERDRVRVSGNDAPPQPRFAEES